jgi:hypothetical protein
MKLAARVFNKKGIVIGRKAPLMKSMQSRSRRLVAAQQRPIARYKAA